MNERGGPTDLRTDALVVGPLSVVTVASVLAIGGVPTPVLLVLAGLVAVSTLFVELRVGHAPTNSVYPNVLLLALALFTLAQAVPIPVTWLAHLSPTAADVWDRALAPLHEPVLRGSLSVDPSATLIEATKWAMYACVFRLAAVAGASRGPMVGVIIVFVSGVLLALITAVHEVLGMTAVYGVYTPHSVQAFHRIGPLLNPNCLAGYLNLSAMCGVAWLQSRRRKAAVAPLIAGIALVVAVAFRAGSRGGMLGLPLGLIVVGAFALARLFRTGRRSLTPARLLRDFGPTGVALVLGLGLGVLGAGRHLWKEATDQNLDKLRLPLMAEPMLRDYPWFGVGRGAFESAFLAYRPVMPSNDTYTHPENFVVQWATEWGVVVAGIAVVAFLWFFRPARVGARRSLAAATALTGVGVLFLQNLADLGLEIPGVSVAAFVVLGSLSASKLPTRKPQARPRFARAVGFLCAGVAGLAVLLCLGAGARDLEADRRSIRDVLESETAAAAGANGRLVRAQMLRHPADYYFPQAGAALAMRSGENPMPWLQRALERGPTLGRPHLLLAQVLFERGARRQALLELRYVVENESTLTGPAANTALRYSRDGDELMLAVPAGEQGAGMLQAMSERLYLADDLPLRDRLDEDALMRNPSLLAPHERIAQSRIDSLRQGIGPCEDRVECVEIALAHADAVANANPLSSRGAQLAALLAIEDGRPEEARTLLASACQAPQDAPRCLAILTRVEPDATIGEVIERYVSVSCSDRKACAAAWDFAAATYADRQMGAQSTRAAMKAAEGMPSVERWVRAADFAARAGLVGHELEALRRADRMGGGKDAGVRARLDRVRSGLRQRELSP
jgi:O-antigen ligase